MIRASMALPLTSKGDWRQYLRAVADNGGNTVRFFLNYLEDDCEYRLLCPYEAAGTWNPGRIAGEAAYDHEVPIYDLTRINPAFLTLLADVASEMKELGIVPWLVFDDRCSEVEGDWRQFVDCYYGSVQLHPWWNANPPSTERAFAGGNKALELNPYREELERRVVEVFRTAGHEVIYAEPENEYGYPVGAAYTIEDMKTWFRIRCDHLRWLGCVVVASVVPDMTAAMVEPWIDLYDQHGIIEVEDIDKAATGLPAAQVIYNTDGAWNGAGDGMSCFEVRDAAPDQMFDLGEEIVRRGAAGGCFLSQKQITSPDDPWDMSVIDHRPLRSLALGTGWTPPEPPEPPIPPIEYVDISVCYDSRLLPNEYCPVKETARFVKGEEPTAICAVHGKPRPCWYWITRLNFRRWFRCAFL